MSGDEGKTPFDPMESLRAMRDAYLDAMAKTMVETVNSEAYAQATGAMLESSLTAAAPFREALEKSMPQALGQLSLPSRQEVLALAERFTHVEMRLDDMDAKLDRILQRLAETKAEAAAGKATHATAQTSAEEAAAGAGKSRESAKGAGARRFLRSRGAERARK